MSARIEVSSESGVVALAGTAAALPAGLDQDSLLRQLEPLAHSAQLFFLVTDDPVRYRIDVIANEPLPPGSSAISSRWAARFVSRRRAGASC